LTETALMVIGFIWSAERGQVRFDTAWRLLYRIRQWQHRRQLSVEQRLPVRREAAKGLPVE